MIHESTMIELCYLLSIDMGVRISYRRSKRCDVHTLDPSDDIDVGDDELVGQLVYDGVGLTECWAIDDNTEGGEMVVCGESFYAMMEEIREHLKEEYS